MPEGEVPFWDLPFNIFGSGYLEGGGLDFPSNFSVDQIWDLVSGGTGAEDNALPQGAVVPPVVISEQPSTIYPGGSPRGEISKEVDVPEGFYLCEIAGVQRLCEKPPPGGWVDLPPVPEEFGDIIRAPVPVPVDDLEEETDDMAHSWLHTGAQILSIFDEPAPQVLSPAGINYGAAGGTASFTNLPSTSPMRAPVSRVTGCKRRRRRRALLTQSDLNVLNQIANLPNNVNVRTALAKAVR